MTGLARCSRTRRDEVEEEERHGLRRLPDARQLRHSRRHAVPERPAIRRAARRCVDSAQIRSEAIKASDLGSSAVTSAKIRKRVAAGGGLRARVAPGSTASSTGDRARGCHRRSAARGRSRQRTVPRQRRLVVTGDCRPPPRPAGCRHRAVLVAAGQPAVAKHQVTRPWTSRTRWSWILPFAVSAPLRAKAAASASCATDGGSCPTCGYFAPRWGPPETAPTFGTDLGTAVHWERPLVSGARGTRTPGLLGAIQALSQLSYSPEDQTVYRRLPAFRGAGMAPVRRYAHHT